MLPPPFTPLHTPPGVDGWNSGASLRVASAVEPSPLRSDTTWLTTVGGGTGTLPQTTELGFAMVPAWEGIAESISSANPSARPHAALKAGEFGGRSLIPLAICVFWLVFIKVICGFATDVQYALRAWTLVGNRETTRKLNKYCIYICLRTSRARCGRDNLAQRSASTRPLPR